MPLRTACMYSHEAVWVRSLVQLGQYCPFCLTEALQGLSQRVFLHGSKMLSPSWRQQKEALERGIHTPHSGAIDWAAGSLHSTPPPFLLCLSCLHKQKQPAKPSPFSFPQEEGKRKVLFMGHNTFNLDSDALGEMLGRRRKGTSGVWGPSCWTQRMCWNRLDCNTPPCSCTDDIRFAKHSRATWNCLPFTRAGDRRSRLHVWIWSERGTFSNIRNCLVLPGQIGFQSYYPRFF